MTLAAHQISLGRSPTIEGWTPEKVADGVFLVYRPKHQRWA